MVLTELLNTLNEEEQQIIANNTQTIQENVSYLKSLDLNNLDEIFTKYYYMFAIDNKKFTDIFNKYEKADLVDKLNKNNTIIEFL